MKQIKNIFVALGLMLPVVAGAQEYSKYYQNLPVNIAQVSKINIPANTISIKDAGGVGDGVTLNTDAFAKAIGMLAQKGGGRLEVPQGVWLTGPIELESNIDLHLDKNAIIYFSADKSLYVSTKKQSNRVLPCISAEKKQNIAITGEGILDGNGQQWRPVKRNKVSDVEWKAYKAMGGQEADGGKLWYPWQMKSGFADIADTPEKQEKMRNDMVRLTNCQNVLIEGVTVQNSPKFHVHPLYCENVIIDGITVRCPWNAQNGDAIDLTDCHRCLIVNSTVDAGDDGLCMKSGNPKNGCITGMEDVLIQDNTVYHAHGAFVLGSETTMGVRRLVVRNCRFAGTDTGLRFKSGVGRGGKTEQLYVQDCVMTDIKEEAIVFQCDYVDRPAGSNPNEAPTLTDEQKKLAPEFQDIHISGIVCRGCNTGIRANGMQELNTIHDIDIHDCTILYTKTDKQVNEQTAKLKLTNVNLVKYHKN